jgi:enolase-phosphatase E1
LLQGLIWEQGYQAGELRGVVYPDVPPAIRRWTAAGIDVAIYSSGMTHSAGSLDRQTTET